MPLLYRTIADRLLSEFEALNWRDGAILPSEAQLQKAFGVSRTTVRRALACLASNGAIQRRQGRGSFYRSRKLGNLISGRVGFQGSAKISGHQPFTRIHSFAVRQPNLCELTVFGPAAREGVVELRRVRFLDGKPAMFQSSVLCHPGIVDLQRSEFENVSLYALLRGRFGMVVTKVNTKLEALNAPNDIARIMSIEPGAAVFNSHRMVEDQNGRYVEVCNNYARADCVYFFFSGAADEFGG
ncbi:MAG: GntR family transcriptional regulator [Rhizobiales bacterium]|nr:GntR family transcriptional regulator [Hyphomicrobiales bacterium]